MTIKFSKDDIVRGLNQLDEFARNAGVTIDLAVYGGSALAIAYDLRESTRDVDAIVRGDPALLRRAVIQVALREKWPEDWLNDGVKGFISSNEDLDSLPPFTASPEGGLRVYVPTPRYLFAMKCMAMRTDADGSRDYEDIASLAKVAGIASPEEALDLVESFYPPRLIPAKVRFGVEEIMQELETNPDLGR